MNVIRNEKKKKYRWIYKIKQENKEIGIYIVRFIYIFVYIWHDISIYYAFNIVGLCRGQ